MILKKLISEKWLMMRFSYLLVCFLALLGLNTVEAQHNKDFGPSYLRCEHLVDPLGIDEANPRLSWRLHDKGIGAKQSAYHLIVKNDTGKEVWNTGKIQSDSMLVRYAGKALEPFTKYHWQVRAWDKDGKEYPATASGNFEMGIMNSSNWQGSWISDGIDITTKPAPYFRKPFAVSKKLKSARIYIAVAGLYELSINGEKIGNQRLDPTYTRFDRRNLYVTHDVTAAIKEGKNALGVLLGNGWYNHQSNAVWFFDKAPWRNRPAFCLDLRITYADGSTEVIATGRDWKTHLSPVIFNSIYTAEHYDARAEMENWDQKDFDDSKWKNAIDRSAPSGKIVAQALHPIRDVEKIETARMKKFSDTSYVFDLGRNISGVSELTVHGDSGTIIRLKHGERIYDNGRVDLSNIDVHYRPLDDQDPFQTDIFILKGTGEKRFRPRFNYKGFQYVEVSSSKPIKLAAENLCGYFMHSDVPPVGSVKSSEPLLNQIWKATNNSYLSNLFGYPTDCPQREKNGWTGDAHIAIETGLYNFDAITVYEKWLGDHRDEQQPNGVLPAIIPTSGWGYQWANGPDWTSTIALIPWNLYLFYGDVKPLTDNYDAIKKYVDHINLKYPTGLTSWGLGDWVPVKSVSPVELTSSIYYFLDADILAKAAALLGKGSDAEKYRKLSQKIKSAINEKFLNKATGIYGTGLQTELAAPLFWGITPDEFKPLVAKRLAEKVKSDNYKLDVGILGAKALLNALSENGYADEAYQIASSKEYPSWGWWMVNGATTLYENWKIDSKSDISMNHIMFGEIGAWLYKALGGIFPDPQSPGFKNVLIKPNFVSGLNRFEASYMSPYGEIISSWIKRKNRVVHKIIIPPNAAAAYTTPEGYRFVKWSGEGKRDKFPDSGTFKISSGNYQFEFTEQQ